MRETTMCLSINTVAMETLLKSAERRISSGVSAHAAPLLTLRRFVCALDRAADCPDWWHVNRLHYFNPELSHQRIARLLGLSRQKVTRWIRDVEIPEDMYESLPCEKNMEL